jgi:hypothetical protein
MMHYLSDEEIIEINAPPDRAVNILILGEGFSDSKWDRMLFKNTVHNFERHFFGKGPESKTGMAPFNLRGVVRKFNIFCPFTPTPPSQTSSDPYFDHPSGISCLMPVYADGVPVDSSKPQPGYQPGQGDGFLADKNSRFNLVYTPKGLASRPRHEHDILDFVAELRLDPRYDPQAVIPGCWDPETGKDKGLIVVLVNDDWTAGNTLSILTSNKVWVHYGVAVSMGLQGNAFYITGLCRWNDVTKRIEFPHSPRRTFDISPDDPNHFLKLNDELDEFNVDYYMLTDMITHELGHSRFGLADEYVGGPVEAFDLSAGDIEYSEPNIISRASACDATRHFTNVKWKTEQVENQVEDVMFDEVRQHVEHVGPLTAANCSNYTPGEFLKTDASESTLPASVSTKLKDNHITPKFPEEVIGLYEGARYQPCGIYRPAGRCKMRAASNYITRPAKPGRSYPFCYVCQRTILQAIAPDLMSLLKAEFRKSRLIK